jgi:hypothetical protein
MTDLAKITVRVNDLTGQWLDVPIDDLADAQKFLTVWTATYPTVTAGYIIPAELGPDCIVCNEPTDSEVLGGVGNLADPDHDDIGRMCPDCAFWCDGNVLPGQPAAVSA